MESFNPKARQTPADVDDASRRRSSGRLDQDTLSCQFGPVSNLSAGGMRMTSRRVPQGEFDIHLYSIGEVVEVRARVAWSKRLWLFKYEIGVEFVDVDAETAKKLTRLATSCRVRRAC